MSANLLISESKFYSYGLQLTVYMPNGNFQFQIHYTDLSKIASLFSDIPIQVEGIEKINIIFSNKAAKEVWRAIDEIVANGGTIIGSQSINRDIVD